MAALGEKGNPLDIDVIVVSKSFSDHKDFNTVRLLVTVQETVCSTVYSLRLCHKGVVWRGELGSPPLIQKVIWIHYDFQIGFKLEFIF